MEAKEEEGPSQEEYMESMEEDGVEDMEVWE